MKSPLRLHETRFIVALQEALIALAPFVILASILTLFSQLPSYFGWQNLALLTPITTLADNLRPFTSIAVVLSLAYHFAWHYEVERVQAMLLTLAVFLSSRALLPLVSPSDSAPPLLSFGLDLWQILIPIASVFLLKALLPFLKISLDAKRCFTYSCRVLQYLYAFLVGYAVLLAGWWGLQQIGAVLAHDTRTLAEAIPDGVLLILRTLVSQGSWFFGIHGNRLANSLFGTALYTREIFPNLTYGQFYRLFAVSGGSGMGLSLLIALFLTAREPHNLKIARISTPFVLFNINTFLIYCLPVALNRFLLLPFLLIPLLNLTIAYALLATFPVAFQTAQVPWTTPVFLDAWIVSGGNLWILTLQLFLIVLDTLIYLPFLKQFLRTQTPTFYQDNLNRHLELPESLHIRQHLNLHKAQHQLIEANLRLEDLTNLLTPETLFIYYQPQVDAQTRQCVGFEALLRLQTPGHPLRGPFFLEDVEKAGLSPILDLWVCNQVKEHLQTWEAQGFTPPTISINLHPDTINSDEAIDKIIHLLEGAPIEFEIVERSLLEGENSEANLLKIKRHGFRVALDDFGQGYSSYRLLSQIDIDTVKADISLIPMLKEPKGQLIWQHMIDLCHHLGIKIIAEGAETEAQVATLTRMGVNTIQGFYFSKAIPMEEVPHYRPPRPAASAREAR